MPGDPTTLVEKLTLGASSTLETFKPLKRICEHVCAFHLYAHDLSRQVEAHHYCSHLSSEVRQCLLYDSGEPGARLIGVEYMISSRLFDTLPTEEKKYWHSHRYEVESGQLYSPNLPAAAQLPAMQAILDNAMYGKTWHFWQVDRGDTLPLGPPQLMMAATGPGQIDAAMLKARDVHEGNSTERHCKAREGLRYPPAESISNEADHVWDGQGAYQVTMVQHQVGGERAED